MASYDSETGIYTVPALGGTDVNRHPVDLLLEVDDEQAVRLATTGEKVYSTGRDPLRGWGPLDGEAERVTARGAAWCYHVPVYEWQQIRAHAKQRAR